MRSCKQLLQWALCCSESVNWAQLITVNPAVENYTGRSLRSATGAEALLVLIQQNWKSQLLPPPAQWVQWVCREKPGFPLSSSALEPGSLGRSCRYSCSGMWRQMELIAQAPLARNDLKTSQIRCFLSKPVLNWCLSAVSNRPDRVLSSGAWYSSVNQSCRWQDIFRLLPKLFCIVAHQA